MTVKRLLFFCGCLVVVICVTSCIKDTVVERYSFYRPIFKTRDAVRASIKGGAPEPLQTPGKLFVKGRYLFLNDVNRGIHVIDMANPEAPQNLAFINIPGNIDMAVKGNILYADQFTDLVTLDISDPRNIRLLDVDERVFPPSSYLADSNLVLAGWQKVDTVVRYRRGFSFNKEATLSMVRSASPSATTGGGKAGSMARFGLLNNRLYTVSHSDLRVFNITDPAAPTFVTTVFPSRGDIETIYPFRDRLFLGSMSGMHIYSVTNPDAPSFSGLFTHATACDPVIAEDTFAFVTLRSGTMCAGFLNQMDVVNVSNINSPVLVRSYPFTNPVGLDKDGPLIILCDGKAGLRVLDGANANNIRTLATVSGIETYDVIASNQVAVTVAKDGVYFIRYSDPLRPVIAGSIKIQK